MAIPARAARACRIASSEFRACFCCAVSGPKPTCSPKRFSRRFSRVHIQFLFSFAACSSSEIRTSISSSSIALAE